MPGDPSITFDGRFETHLTIAASEASQIACLKTWAAARGLKCLHIELSRGTTPSQPMLTWHSSGVLSDQMNRLRNMSADLQHDGFRVIRAKLEADPDNYDVPADDVAAQQADESRYFEHHVKLLLPADSDLASLQQVAEQHAGHLSRNALRQRDDGLQERFVTQRCWSVGRDSAQATLTRLLHDLTMAGYNILETEAEYVVYDSNLSLDAGWIRASETHD